MLEKTDLSDNDLMEMLRENSDILSFIYEKHREYCLNFMKSMFNDLDEIKDIYQDAILVLHEKAQKQDFQLTCSIQTYLNSICKNQIRKRFTIRERNSFQSIEGNEGFLENLTDWFDDSHLVCNERVTILKSILSEMKQETSKCYELLKRYFFKNQTMEKIAQKMEYTNADNAKNQKYRCQKKLQSELFRRLG